MYKLRPNYYRKIMTVLSSFQSQMVHGFGLLLSASFAQTVDQLALPL